jgi:hypothetical protein
VAESSRRGKGDPEYELADTGVFDAGRYFDVQAEYAKAGPDDLLLRVTVSNRGPERATLHLLPTLWFRNTWSWGGHGENFPPRPEIILEGATTLRATHATLGAFSLAADIAGEAGQPTPLFTDNETNFVRVFGTANSSRYVKDAFHEYVVHGRQDAVNPAHTGTKAAFHYRFEVDAGASVTVRLRLAATDTFPTDPFGSEFDETFADRMREADEFYAARIGALATPAERAVVRQAYAGLLWTNSSTTTSSRTGSTETRASRRRHPSAERDATPTGGTSTPVTCCPCPTSGSTRGSRRGTSRSTSSRSRGSIPSSRSIS